ncbi:MAG: IS5/IS1182 family transposase, partial [Bacteroidetes bacterium]|nr:IS5/IS1182 family transposase [Bacteroidota bacterium]
QTERLTGRLPKVAVVDRGYRGRKEVKGVDILSPKKLSKKATAHLKQKMRKLFRARAGIEPIIGHLKHDHRMERNYLSGNIGDNMNTILAATGFNMMKMLKRLKTFSLENYFLIFRSILFPKFQLCLILN